ncbi:hypothetical protein RNJ44_01677 [Nakaseomyces bracarensis]|uniref:Uncharacterized protein n=1 Tax=Nakaseomyces bracarensis TaxID=273131 RepID=A0ABR4NNG3_9SACH
MLGRRYKYIRRVITSRPGKYQVREIVTNYNDPNDTNLGNLANYLKNTGVPNLLQENLKESILDEAIVLRLLPIAHPYIPNLHGLIQYNASMNAIRLIMRKFVLEETSRIKILSSKRISGAQGEDIRQQCKLSPYLTNNDKLLIKWQSCLPQNADPIEPEDDDFNKTFTFSSNDSLEQKKGSPILDYILQKNPAGSPNLSPGLISQHITIGNKLTSMNNDDTTDNEFTRIVNGIFVFEMNEDNTKITVHTIENVELIDYERRLPLPKGAFAC